MTWFWISKGKLNYCQSKVCVSCWFFSRWLFQFKFLVEEANNWIEEPVYRLVMWEAERGNTELYTFHIRAKSNGVQAWNRRKRGYMNKVIEEEIWCTVSFFLNLAKQKWSTVRESHHVEVTSTVMDVYWDNMTVGTREQSKVDGTMDILYPGFIRPGGIVVASILL